jgi:uncharacterized protein (DUF1800 family)
MPLASLPSSPLGPKRAAHLLRRATFGPTIQQIKDFAAMTPTQAITALYHTTLQTPTAPIDLKTGTEWVTAGATDANSKDDVLCEYFKGWFISQMLNTNVAYAAREKLVYFLHTHFTAIQSKIGSSRALYFQNKLYRLFALDGVTDPKISFKELAKKVSVDNAMIRLLDGNLNVKGNPNENYARELLELYTIGRGLENSVPPGLPAGDYGVYKELDVQMAARVLSGWDYDDTFSNMDPDTNIPRAIVKGSTTNASSHDNDDATPKQFSPHFANAIIAGDPLLMNGSNATEASALDEIDQLIEMIFGQLETRKNICRKLYRFFVYHEITTDPGNDIDDTIITTMANDLLTYNFKIQYVIEDLLKSQHFYEGAAGFPDDNFGGIIKSPLELIANVVRFFEVPMPDMAASTSDFYSTTAFILNEMKEMSMDFYEPYDVSGYDAYHQYPIFHRSWLTPNTLPRRYKFIAKLLDPNSMDIPININVFDWLKGNPNIADATSAVPQDLVIALVGYLFPVPDNLTFDDTNDDVNSGLTSQRLNYFRIRLLDGGPPNGFDDSYWTNMLWPGGQPDLRLPLNDLFNAILQSPEFQLQ